jgi:hypothetical protein
MLHLPALQVAKFDDPHEACLSVVAESYRSWLQYETRTDDITMIMLQLTGLNQPPPSSNLSRCVVHCVPLSVSLIWFVYTCWRCGYVTISRRPLQTCPGACCIVALSLFSVTWFLYLLAVCLHHHDHAAADEQCTSVIMTK